MSEIPEDVSNRAEALLNSCYAPDDEGGLSFDFPKAKEAIARAILAERARCASLADEADEMSGKIYRPGQTRGATRATASWIAQSIRRGDEKTR